MLIWVYRWDIVIFITAKALVELAGKNIGHAPEPSLGTHFFQDLLEAQIYPLAIMLDDEQNSFSIHIFLSSYPTT